MEIRILALLSALGVFCGCSKTERHISVLCEKEPKGNYTLKWEVYPEQDDATIEIYASDNDTVFPSQPILRTDVNKFIAVIENADSLNYSYFKLKVGNTFSDVVTNRLYHFDEIQNFRDIGGYKTKDGRQVKWGKVFRSGEFSAISEDDRTKMKEFDFESIIDFRSQDIQEMRRDIFQVANRYEVYVAGTSNDSVAEQILWDRFLRVDAILYMQDTYEAMIMNYTEQYAAFFDCLTDERNYPLVFHCSLGRDQSGIAAYFLLKALDVPSEVLEDDYMFSNIGIDKSKIIKDPSGLSESQQEAFTMLTRTDASYLNYGLSCAKKQEGSLEDFMLNKLKLTKEKREKLRDILLYKK